MSRSPLLLVAGSGLAQTGDQLMFATLPLLAATAGASPRAIGLLVAAQTAGWFVMSLPSGVLADRMSRRALIGFGGLVMAAAGLLAGAMAWVEASPPWFGLAGILGSCGVVLMALSLFALVPSLVPVEGRGLTNARIELARAGAGLLAPVVAGLAVARGRADLVFLGVVAAGLLVMLVARALPEPAPTRDAAAPPLGFAAALGEGFRFVIGEPMLRAIAACAVFWNFAFMVLSAAVAPHAIRTLGLTAESMGLAWSAWGAGMVLGALLAPRALRSVSMSALLVFGPAVSSAAAMAVASATPGAGFVTLAAGFALLGFGPMLWLVTQTTIRQAITPPALMGRVAATIQFAIYGVRPLGALAGGAVGGWLGLEAALWLAAAAFAASLASILVSIVGRGTRPLMPGAGSARG